ncbi:MAG: arylsulfatase [Cyclobacteriaceae bacterium]
MKGSTLKLICVCAIMCNGFLSIAQQQNKPNVIFILADDFGYSSLNCYGADKNLVRTPNIDRLAEKGMKYTNAYTAASVCSPTRYSFLMGRYPWRSEMKYGTWGVTSRLLPDPNKTTIADWLKERGYNTAAIGKWHLGYGKTNNLDEFTKPFKPGPNQLGFDYHFGVPQNHGDKMGVFIENDHIYGIRSEKIEAYSRTYYGPQYYGFDAPQRINIQTMEVLTDKTIDWLSQQSNETPFFLYYAPVAVHHPITPSNYMRGMSNCGPYGDFIQDLDWSVGRIIQTLEYKGLLENSIIIFTSDNGGDIPSDRPESPESFAVNAGLEINGGLRGDKHVIWEGGTRVPFIVSWPGKVEEGSDSEDIIAVMDVFATVADITDNGLPDDKKIAPDSYSFFPSMTGQKQEHSRTSVVTADMHGMQALRMGDWKFIDNALPENLPANRRKKIKMPLELQLYNLSQDPSEQNNLYEKNPDKAKKLIAELKKIRSESASRK